jgi:hypothetical protein
MSSPLILQIGLEDLGIGILFYRVVCGLMAKQAPF